MTRSLTWMVSYDIQGEFLLLERDGCKEFVQCLNLKTEDLVLFRNT